MSKKKKILLLSDDMRTHSGIATMSKEIVLNTVHKYDWVQLGAAVKHPEVGKHFDASDSIAEESGVQDAIVKIIPFNGYGNQAKLRDLIITEQPDAILHFTDPRFWGWLYDMEDEVRRYLPIMYLNVWDSLPDPEWNHTVYSSCDLLMGISKQTYGINKRVLDKFGENYKDWQIKYVPHGVSKKFRPIQSDSDEFTKVTELKDKMGISDKKFVVLWNNRNLRRKNPGDVILAYKELCDGLTKEEANDCVLLLHTALVDPKGMNLPEVIKHICPDYDVVFTHSHFSTDELNLLYNLSDVTINMASNEGFGLVTCESMAAGTPIIVNVTGGMQDQCGFTVNGKFLTADDYIELGSLHNRKTLPENLSWGRWVKPVWPSNRSLLGSPQTPYIFDDRCKFEDVGKALRQWYDMDNETRIQCGLDGSEFASSEESGMSAKNMGNRLIEAMDGTFANWSPKK